MEAAPAKLDNSCDDDCELPAAYLRLEQEIFRIGRDPDANSFSIQTDSESLVSRNHCEIYVIVYEASVNHVYVRDRKSVNGTFVNGRIIGVFENEYIISPRCLGTGGEGAVYLAIEPKTKRQLVCKLVNLGRQDGKMPREELYRKLQEINVLRQLKHPNILPYIDAVISPHSLYIFTELASGGDLVSFINRHEFIQELDCRIILRQVIRGLAYLHRKGIIHRDLKPENILLAYSPKIAYHRIMLSDFGACAVPRRSRMVTDIGTFEYKAPEMFSTGEAQTTAVDLWSLGVVSLRLLTMEAESFENLARMDQQSLEQMVRAMIKEVSPKHSSNSQRFTLACLQLTPVNRITAAEAECHDWFCTPQKHFEFFQQLDRRCLSDLGDDAQLKPMPWDLANLQSPPIPLAPTKLSTTSAHKSIRWSLPPCTETSGFFRDLQQDMKAVRMGPLPGLTSPLHESGVLTCKPKSAKESPNVTRKEEQDQNTPLRDRHIEDRKAETRIMTPHQLRVCDVLQLPLPGLDRHLKPPHSKTHRQDVSAELKRLDANFLTNTMQAPMENGTTGGEERAYLTPAGKYQQPPQ
ncbi:kinase-like domain-containing protein [Trichoderma compactum]